MSLTCSTNSRLFDLDGSSDRLPISQAAMFLLSHTELHIEGR